VQVADLELGWLRGWFRGQAGADSPAGPDIATLPKGPEFAAAELAERAGRAERLGLSTVWVPQYAIGMDAVAALAAIARSTSRIELGTAILPILPRHPLVVAQQAETLRDLSGGRFTLGIGVALPDQMEGVYGIPFRRPAARMEAFLDRLSERMDGDGSRRPQVLVAALGERMLRLAGAKSDGIILTYVNARAIEDYAGPIVNGAARQAGRSAPRIVVAQILCVTDDPASARAHMAEVLAPIMQIPQFRVAIDRDGLSSAADVALVGDEGEVEAGIRRLFAAGATDVAALLFGDTLSRDRAWELLSSLSTQAMAR
jgi:alkanesulfonate monooxygenase SsuD/methylene tetrahydromethanopterin reductase-like flavin-dependent oxidoreductase (luciferase family)